MSGLRPSNPLVFSLNLLYPEMSVISIIELCIEPAKNLDSGVWNVRFSYMGELYDVIPFDTKVFDTKPNFFMISTGIGESDFERLVAILTHIDCNWICIDIANGYLDVLITFCRRVRAQFPDKIIVAGNVVTREIVEDLILGGVDIGAD